MRSLTISLPLIAMLVALTQGLFVGGSYDAGADPRSVEIMAQKHRRMNARRAQQARYRMLAADRSSQLVSRY